MDLDKIFILSPTVSHQYQNAINISIVGWVGSDYSRLTFAERFGNGKDPNPKIKISDPRELTIWNSEKLKKFQDSDISDVTWIMNISFINVNIEIYLYFFLFELGKNTFSFYNLAIRLVDKLFSWILGSLN